MVLIKVPPGGKQGDKIHFKLPEATTAAGRRKSQAQMQRSAPMVTVQVT